MKIAVTGAGGFLGRGIVKALIKKGVDVIAVGNHVDQMPGNIVKISKNIFEMQDPFIEMGRPDVVLHLAWKDGFKHSSDAHLENLNKHIIFVKKLFESPMKKLAVMGTVHEIGFFEGSVDENTPTNPQSEYGIAKNALREYVELCAQRTNKPFQWLRAFYIVKPDLVGESIFSKLMQAGSEGKHTFPFGSGKNQNDFLDYGEFSEMVAETIVQDEVLGIINIASGEPQPLAKVVENFIRQNGLDITLDYGVYPQRQYDSKAVWGDSRKIKKIMSRTRA